MAEKVNKLAPHQQNRHAGGSSEPTAEAGGVIPDRARKALTETRAAIKDIRAGLSKEFGTVTRDILAALRKSDAGQPQKEPAGRVMEARRRASSSVERDARGLVTRVVYADGTARQFAYDTDSALEAVTDKDGSTWKLRDAIWIQFGADGSVTGEIWEGKIAVDSSGVYLYEDPTDRSRIFERPDGSRLLEDPSGMRMEADANGQVTAIQYPDSSSRQFHYGSGGDLNRVVDKDGTTWKTSDGLRWFQYAAGGLKTGEVSFGRRSIDASGSYMVEDGATGKRLIEEPYGAKITESSDGSRLIESPDGTLLIEKPDGTRLYTTADGTHISETPTGFLARRPSGAEIEADSNRRITKISYPDKTMRNFKYDDAGSLVQVWDRDGTIWKATAENTWLQYRPDGAKTGQTRAGSISVDEHATCIYQDSQTGITWIEQADGSRITQVPSGAALETGPDGSSSSYVSVHGRRFTVSTEGFLRYQVGPGDALAEIAADALCYRHIFEPEYRTSEEEIARETRRLARLNAVDETGALEPGKLLMIKAQVETLTPEVIREVRQTMSNIRAAALESGAYAGSTSEEDRPAGAGPARPVADEPGTKRQGPRNTFETFLPWFSEDIPNREAPGQETAPDAATIGTQPDATLTEAALVPSDQSAVPVESGQPPSPVGDTKSGAPDEAAVPVPQPTVRPQTRIAPWSRPQARSTPAAKLDAAGPTPVRDAAPAAGETVIEPEVPREKRVAPWSRTKPQPSSVARTPEPPPPVAQPPLPSVPDADSTISPEQQAPPPKPIVPRSDTQSSGAPPEYPASPQSAPAEAARRVAPWSVKRGDGSSQARAPNAAPQPQTTTAPTPSPERSQTVEHARRPDDNLTTVSIDKAGHVTRVSYANGSYKEFDYDQYGNVFQFRDHQGRVTRQNDDLSWKSFTADGRGSGGAPSSVVRVDREGNVIWEYLRDGSVTVQRTDGSVLRLDNAGEPLYYISSAERQFTFAGDGSLEHAVGENDTASEIATDALKCWCWDDAHYSPPAELIEEQRRLILQDNKLEQEPEPHSTIVIKRPASAKARDLAPKPLQIALIRKWGGAISVGPKTVEKPDGSKLVLYPDSSKLEIDARGKVARFIGATGRAYRASAGGVLLYEFAAGDTLEAIASDALRYAHRESPTYSPSQRDVRNQAERILHENNLDDAKDIREGDALVIPSANTS
jgi:YD repeat-containing protein